MWEFIAFLGAFIAGLGVGGYITFRWFGLIDRAREFFGL